MVKIRLLRIGKKNDPQYRIVITPARTKRDGKVIEFIGHYDPKSKNIKINTDRAKYWISVGAQPTKTVHSFLAKQKIVKPLEHPKHLPKKPKKEEQKEKKAEQTPKKVKEETEEKKETSSKTQEKVVKKEQKDTEVKSKK
jgi:small subunit ribosomal protein S16